MDTWNVRRRDILLWLVQIPWHVQRTDRAACQRLSSRSGAAAARGQAAWHHAAMLGFVGQGPCWASLSACRLCRLRAASQRGCRRQAAECCCWDCLIAAAGCRCREAMRVELCGTWLLTVGWPPGSEMQRCVRAASWCSACTACLLQSVLL